MPTAKPRFNVTLPPETAALIKQLARREKKSTAMMTRDILLEGLSSREDIALSKLAELSEKDQKGKRTYSHKEAWS